MPCNTYNVGRFVSQNTDVFLRSIGPDGKPQLTYNKATPEAMAVLIEELDRLTDELQVRINDLSPSLWNEEVQKLRFNFDHWLDDLSVYRSHVEQAVEEGAGPQAIYHCVTAPLLLGWYPNADCTGPNPAQTQQMTAAVGVPLEMLNRVLCIQDAQEHASESVADYFIGLRDGLIELSEDLSDAAANAAAAASAAAKAVAKLSPTTLALLVAAGIGAYILLRD